MLALTYLSCYHYLLNGLQELQVVQLSSIDLLRDELADLLVAGNRLRRIELIAKKSKKKHEISIMVNSKQVSPRKRKEKGRRGAGVWH